MITEETKQIDEGLTTLCIDVPRNLAEALSEYIEVSGKTQNDVGQAAIALMLLQNGVTRRDVSKAYLDALFG